MKNYVSFKNVYVLIEDIKDKFQPYYKEYLTVLPKINLNSPILCCPFSNLRRSANPPKKKRIKSGCCEICYLRFENYNDHVESKEHKEYAADDFNYRMIDLFIKEMIEKELFNGVCNLNSPCEKLEASFSNSKYLIYNKDPHQDTSSSIIEIAQDSFKGQENTVCIEAILNKIQKKYSQEK